jgi:tetratricopeptide (TPR) repeat protein
MIMANESSIQPALADLAARYLHDQAEAHDAGLGRHDGAGEVMLFEAGPVQTIDPKPAWQEAQAVLPYLTVGQRFDLQPPSFWSALVAAQEPAVSIAFCAGNYPQLVSDWQTIVRPPAANGPLSGGGAPLPLSLQEWTESLQAARSFPEALLAVGCLRLARHYEAAANFIRLLAGEVPAAWRSAWANEVAALAWHKGDHEEALEAWNKQEASIPVLFNRGMAAFFLGKKKDAEAPLAQASAGLPETTSWHHLGQLYLILARLP